MKNLKYYILLGLITIMQLGYSQTKLTVDAFDSAEISPHIHVTFVEGTEESVTIEESLVPEDKINIKVKGKTLHIYLDDAKNVTKTDNMDRDGTKMSVPIYKGKILTITVTYKKLKELTIKGEGSTLFNSPIKAESFDLKIYGESKIVFNEVDFNEFDVDTYGESFLEIKKGRINNQKITAYGEGQINLFSIDNKTTKITAYGEAEFKINASNVIKITAYGEAEIQYKGDATIEKGLTIGDVKISKVD
ncbi:head GIN domain-containing protein [Formosa sp. PL04]|uniref:head GIN domain-containing protein n=1 Tax=Formosa sp. PL04 TaxID=3081755 RepID=UPI002982A30F|nr:head GIN domain-containing protein [Formosa sp. PL04]MDW5290174.1 head GIN domain-containing protein [Formosa sp. PL04]